MRVSTAALLLAAALLGGCAGRPASQGAPTPVVVLIDRSASTVTVKDRYLEHFRQVTASLRGGERLLVLPLSGASLTAPPALDVTFPAYDRVTDNSFTHERTLKRLRQEAEAKVAAMLAEDPGSAGQRTAILDGLLRAEEWLRGETGGTVCIISDMVEDSDVLRLEGVTESTVPAMLTRVAAAGRMPARLRSVNIHVAGLDAAGAIPPARVLAIRRFWEQVFEGAGATLIEYGPSFHRLHSGHKPS